MAEQKAKARAAWAGSGEAADATVWFDVAEKHGVTEFLGYETETAQGQVKALVMNGILTERANEGDTVQVALNQTPFYAESGGQVGDTGVIRTDTGEITVTDTRKAANVFAHMGKVTKGTVKVGQAADLVVDHARRTSIRANHSATHLLHEALRAALGDHVAQRGSLNAPDRLRFDFSHTKALTPAELSAVEAEVNAYVRQNAPVETRIMTPDDARALGAQALFGEKYGDEVRVVSMGRASGSGKGSDKSTYSLELCGGTHVRQTGDIGAFVVLGDSSSSSGIRRIEALTGTEALNWLREQEATLSRVAAELKTSTADVPDRVRALLDERRALTNEIAQLRRERAMSGGGVATHAPQDINGVKFLAQVLSGVTGKELPALVDEYKAKLGSGVVLLIADADGKAAVASGVTADLKDTVSAVDIVKTVVAELGGKGGGGRPDLAQGGGKDLENVDSAIAAAKTILKG